MPLKTPELPGFNTFLAVASSSDLSMELTESESSLLLTVSSSLRSSLSECGLTGNGVSGGAESGLGVEATLCCLGRRLGRIAPFGILALEVDDEPGCSATLCFGTFVTGGSVTCWAGFGVSFGGIGNGVVPDIVVIMYGMVSEAKSAAAVEAIAELRPVHLPSGEGVCSSWMGAVGLQFTPRVEASCSMRPTSRGKCSGYSRRLTKERNIFAQGDGKYGVG